MKNICLSLFLASTALLAQPALAAGPEGVRVTPVMAQDLADMPGKEGLMITVDYAPGARPTRCIAISRARLVYVLEGSIVMQVKRRQGSHADGRPELL